MKVLFKTRNFHNSEVRRSEAEGENNIQLWTDQSVNLKMDRKAKIYLLYYTDSIVDLLLF